MSANTPALETPALDTPALDTPALDTPALTISDLTVTYRTSRGEHTAVDRVSLQVQPGEIVAVVGETGSGKSTTAHAVLGLLPTNAHLRSGRIAVHGTDITGWSQRRLRSVRGAQVGLVPQDPANSLDPLKTVGWQLAETLRIHRYGSSETREQLIASLLEQVGLAGVPGGAGRVAASYPHELSGGMRQRVLIANAIALQPSLVIADEPTSALDVTVQKQVLDVLAGLRDSTTMGVILVTHDLGLAAERADRLVVLKGGQVQDSGPVETVITRPRATYTRNLLAHSPALNPRPFRPALLAAPDQFGPDQPGPDQFGPDQPGPDRPVVISAKGVHKQFPGRSAAAPVQALAGVDVAVQAGTTHGLVGESGSGKSTLARILLGLQSSDMGQVKVAGIDVRSASRSELRELRRTVQLVYQNPFSSLNPAMTVRQIVADPLRNFKIGNRRTRAQVAAEVLEQVALDPQLHMRKPRELSGGQRQRVAIARALVLNPEIVVLDEAVSALDVSVQSQILQLLSELQKSRNLTYLFITHDLDVVRQACDFVTVLRGGQVVEQGSARQILTDPQTPYARQLVESVPKPRFAVAT